MPPLLSGLKSTYQSEMAIRDLADKLGVRPETVLKYPRRFPSLPITIEGNRVIRRPNPR